MRGPSASDKGAMAAFKRDLLKNLLLGLRARAEACAFDAMSLQERKRAVKRSADVAMAAARGAAAAGAGRAARWPKAIMAAGASSSSSSSPGMCKARKSRCKRVVRRCVDAKRTRGVYAAASAAAAPTSSDVARRLARRRAMALRKVIPGGDAAIGEAALLREAMDYVVHLRAQVDVLRRVSAAVQRSTVLRDPAQSMGES